MIGGDDESDSNYPTFDDSSDDDSNDNVSENNKTMQQSCLPLKRKTMASYNNDDTSESDDDEVVPPPPKKGMYYRLITIICVCFQLVAFNFISNKFEEPPLQREEDAGTSTNYADTGASLSTGAGNDGGPASLATTTCAGTSSVQWRSTLHVIGASSAANTLFPATVRDADAATINAPPPDATLFDATTANATANAPYNDATRMETPESPPTI